MSFCFLERGRGDISGAAVQFPAGRHIAIACSKRESWYPCEKPAFLSFLRSCCRLSRVLFLFGVFPTIVPGEMQYTS
ncbi:hypothetical protein Y032_0462g1887 [Ancylostoma ceylanicum]|uniref:Uncharacterized protein n=1 Tax=Ancylostoma ceylanicum TaxID=53326 RepID=A0A016WYP6_9BILA|nr:hypothetical protein Y032_0462g1887 [Ancylostoma ceylanicum]